MKKDFDKTFCYYSPWLDKAVKERMTEEPGNRFVPTGLRVISTEKTQMFLHNAIDEKKTKKMARNCEKKLIGLNRLWLEKQQKGWALNSPSLKYICSEEHFFIV